MNDFQVPPDDSGCLVKSIFLCRAFTFVSKRFKIWTADNTVYPLMPVSWMQKQSTGKHAHWTLECVRFCIHVGWPLLTMWQMKLHELSWLLSMARSKLKEIRQIGNKHRLPYEAVMSLQILLVSGKKKKKYIAMRKWEFYFIVLVCSCTCSSGFVTFAFLNDGECVWCQVFGIIKVTLSYLWGMR